MTGTTTPLILVVSGDEGVRQQLVRDIARRFGADYWVAAAPTTDAALGRLESRLSPAPAPPWSLWTSGWPTRRPPISCCASINFNPRPNGSC